MEIMTDRLIITEFAGDMIEAVHLNSLDEDNRRFVPDEVFETVDDARETVEFLMTRYEALALPLVYPVLLKDGTYIGYVQLAEIDEGCEIGYHIGAAYTRKGYAAEAVRAFLPEIMHVMRLSEVYGICVAENVASVRVMEKCGFEKTFEGVGPYQGAQRRICRYVYRLRAGE